MALDPYERISWRGVTANRRTVEMLEITELRSLTELTPLRIPQGSYTSGVSASGGTHSGGGALDISVRDLTSGQRDMVVRELRETSFAAWYRPYLANVWPAHIHAIAIGDKEMSGQAAWQVQEYKAGRNGLANQGPDNGPDVPITVYRQDIDMSYYGPEKWDAADLARLTAVVAKALDADHGEMARAVIRTDGLIRNLSETDENAPGYWVALSTLLSDVENTQDQDHALLAKIAEKVLAAPVPPA